MSMLDKIAAAVMPPESEQQRAEARAKARAASAPGDWLSMVLDHHEGIEAAFATLRSATEGTARAAALERLAVLLTGHAQAEESVLYPVLAASGEKMHAGTGYEQQSAVKVEMALIETLDPTSREFLDKLRHIEGAVAHHVYAEEHNWFLDLLEKVSAHDQARLAQRYKQEYERYVRQSNFA